MRTLLILLLPLLIASCLRIPDAVEEEVSITLEEFARMPQIAKECSGMILTDTELLVHNDGGDAPTIYHLAKNGIDTIKSSIIDGAVNVDWEAMTMHNDEILVGDFGNNLGKRKDLKIYHIDKNTFELKETISFAYPDQLVFDDTKHNFDCEAIIVKDGKYFLFSKNRADRNSNIYSAALKTNNFNLVDSIALEGMVTDAVFHAESNTVVLLCYQFGIGGFKNTLAIVKPLDNGEFRTTSIHEIGPAEQFEAITHIKGNKFLIGSEQGLGNGRRLYTLTINGL